MFFYSPGSIRREEKKEEQEEQSVRFDPEITRRRHTPHDSDTMAEAARPSSGPVIDGAPCKIERPYAECSCALVRRTPPMTNGRHRTAPLRSDASGRGLRDIVSSLEFPQVREWQGPPNFRFKRKKHTRERKLSTSAGLSDYVSKFRLS